MIIFNNPGPLKASTIQSTKILSENSAQRIDPIYIYFHEYYHYVWNLILDQDKTDSSRNH